MGEFMFSLSRFELSRRDRQRQVVWTVAPPSTVPGLQCGGGLHGVPGGCSEEQGGGAGQAGLVTLEG